MANAERALRADARLNEDRVLHAAAEAFQREDGDTSMKAIAKDAGVGIGTLYRRFPTREQLIEAVYRSETERLVAAVPTLLARNPPEKALRKWVDKFLTYMLTKQGMAEALPAILARQNGLRLHSRDLLRDAIAELLAAAQDSFRTDVPADDVMMAIGGIALIAGHEGDRALAGRLSDLLVDSLAPRPKPAAKARTTRAVVAR